MTLPRDSLMQGLIQARAHWLKGRSWYPACSRNPQPPASRAQIMGGATTPTWLLSRILRFQTLVLLLTWQALKTTKPFSQHFFYVLFIGIKTIMFIIQDTFGVFSQASYLGYNWYSKNITYELCCVMLEKGPQAFCILRKLHVQPLFSFYLEAGPYFPGYHCICFCLNLPPAPIGSRFWFWNSCGGCGFLPAPHLMLTALWYNLKTKSYVYTPHFWGYPSCLEESFF